MDLLQNHSGGSLSLLEKKIMLIFAVLGSYHVPHG